MRINCYGERADGPTYDKPIPHVPLETKFIGGVTYDLYGTGERAPIHRTRVGEDGMVVEEWAWGRWEDRETLSYSPFTETKEVDG